MPFEEYLLLGGVSRLIFSGMLENFFFSGHYKLPACRKIRK